MTIANQSIGIIVKRVTTEKLAVPYLSEEEGAHIQVKLGETPHRKNFTINHVLYLIMNCTQNSRLPQTHLFDKIISFRSPLW